MALYLDSARVEDAQRAIDYGFIEGITTNPARIVETGRDGLDVLTDLTRLFDGEVFYQVKGISAEARLDEAWKAYDIRPDRVVIKLVACIENLALIPKLSGVTIAITGIFSPMQAYMAAQAGADYVMPYIHRSPERAALVREMAEVLYDTETEIIAANIVSEQEALACLKAGAHHLTLPLTLIESLSNHSLSQEVMKS